MGGLMKFPGDAIYLFFDDYSFRSKKLDENIPNALIVLSEALLAIAESNREIAEANNRAAEAIESLAKEGPYTPGPLGIIAEAVKQMAENG
jgi:hypothetical protein